jgi:hypothetical protein
MIPALNRRGLDMTRFETIAIPPLFWDDLKQVLGMFVQSRIATIREELTRLRGLAGFWRGRSSPA